MIKAVLFDFDGTLTAPGGIDFAAIKAEIGCPSDRPILEFIEQLPTLRAQRRASLVLERFEEQSARRARPNRDAEHLILLLRRRGLRTGVLTRNSCLSVKAALKNFNRIRRSDFDTIIARDHVRRPKPDPEGVLLAARRMRLPVCSLLVVGDYFFDVLSGQRAGARTVFLESALTKIRPDPPADWTVRRLREIVAIVSATNGWVTPRRGGGRVDSTERHGNAG